MATTTRKKRQRNPPASPARWRAGSRFPVKAATAADALGRIQIRDGSISPGAVVDAARSPRHPLHKCFCWDDTEAAEKWRQQQARQIISCLCVVERGDPDAKQSVGFVSVVTRETGRAYLPASVVMGDEEYRAASLREALASLRGWQRRYRHLSELAGLFAAIEEAGAKAKPTRKAA